MSPPPEQPTARDIKVVRTKIGINFRSSFMLFDYLLVGLRVFTPVKEERMRYLDYKMKVINFFY
ncbi:MAG: hypothetical protein CMO72_01975 [Verrucomicrobiales bacterium]|nr:hypothetical protein [Verrucomicrobiales bacterium]